MHDGGNAAEPQPHGEVDASGGDSMDAGLSLCIAEHVAAIEFDDLPSDVATATKTSILDQIGVILAASGLGEGIEPFVELARSGAGSAGSATILGHGFTATPALAALANGAMAHVLDYEDTHDATLVHPYAAVVPAALAVAEAENSSGADFVAAVAAGADLNCRIGLAFAMDPEQASPFSLLPMIGAFGATAAVARLLGLTPHQTVQAFATAWSQTIVSSAFKAYGPSQFRAVRDGFNAQAAVLACLLARQGFEMFDRPFEGEAGYFAVFARGRYHGSALLDGLGERFENTQISYKPWPCCRGTHTAIDAGIQLLRENRFDQADIVGIEVRVSSFFASLCEPREVRIAPPTGISAKFSIPFSLGVALARGKVTFQDFEPAALRDPDVLRLAALVSPAVLPGNNHADATRGGITLTLRDGTVLRRDVIHPLGHPRNPMRAESLDRKFLECAALAAAPFAPGSIAHLADQIRNLETIESVRALASSAVRTSR